MVRELDVQAQPDELPALGAEVVQVLVEHPRVQARIQAFQVPDVDCVLDPSHCASLGSTVGGAGRFRGEADAEFGGVGYAPASNPGRLRRPNRRRSAR
jgi:hypothetical protein